MPKFRNRYLYLRGPETTQKWQILNGHVPKINSSHSVWFEKKSELPVHFSPFIPLWGGGRISSSKSWIIEARPTNCHLLAIYRPTTRKLFRSRQAAAAAPMRARLCVPDPKYGANNVKWTCRLTTTTSSSSSQHHQCAVQGLPDSKLQLCHHR